MLLELLSHIFSALPDITCVDEVIYGVVGNGYCNDETNNADCNYDGGDCCGTCVKTNHCSECECLGEVSGNEICNAHCNYDGGEYFTNILDAIDSFLDNVRSCSRLLLKAGPIKIS